MRLLLGGILLGAMGLTGCGTVAPNSDVGLVHTGFEGKVVVPDRSDVAITDTGPILSDEKQRVMGTSCKNKLWDPDPSRENALALMKRQAAERGYNAVHSVKVFSDPTAVAKNCWSALVASGIAYTVIAPSSGTSKNP